MNTRIGKGLAAFLLIAAGVVLLLANVEIISLEMNLSWGMIYPLFILLLGLKLWGSAYIRRGGSWTAGSFLTVFAVLLILDRFGIMTFRFWDFWKLWPMLFIYIGFGIMRGRSRNRNQQFFDQPLPVSRTMAVGDFSFTEENWKVEPMNVWSAVSDYKFDFTKAFIPDEDIPIRVAGWAGDVRMFVPRQVPFRVDAKVRAGDIKVAGQKADGINRIIQYETRDYQEAGRKLTIQIELTAGSIKVVQV
ncbi:MULTISPECIES: cell wall-active antibiotics response protein LiaF [Halobacillus]|uniref:cell wall-active antibiotics response protein LiaF n=1 Tax=Halobacillus TaxID=45667 RepID=UPI0013690601|nr:MULTISPECIES: cell wall-active antibiotics response protein LiaF [Halobacillus]MYL30604.1 hypothetical protein [Halobacillus halophilus]MYL38621.1 hypothetical protein [Halobacillus litoralis]